MKFIEDFKYIKSNYYVKIMGDLHYDIKISDNKFYKSFQSFIVDFDNYSKIILKNKQFSEKELSEYIFEFSFKSLSKYKESLRKNLYATKLYLEYLNDKITPKNIKNYYDLLTIFLTDFEFLVYEIENYYLKTENKKNVNSFRNYFKKPIDIYDVAKTFFFIDEIKKVDELYSYDIRPYSIFAIRQLIEIYGKDILGIISIFDENDVFSKKHINVAWDFIKEETNKKDKSRIHLPFDIDIVIKIQKWTNKFVHTTTDSQYYVIYNAIKMLEKLFNSNQNGILCYNNKIEIKYDISDVKIIEYENLKKDFQIYLNKNNPEFSNKYSVAWESINKVGAYIISK